jgi:hypothetical protein
MRLYTHRVCLSVDIYCMRLSSFYDSITCDCLSFTSLMVVESQRMRIPALLFRLS